MSDQELKGYERTSGEDDTAYHKRLRQGVRVLKAEQNHHLPREHLSQESVMSSPPKRIRRSQSSDFDITKCAICQKDKITISKGARTREALTLNISEIGSASLIKAAEIRNDNRLLLNIQHQDTIAMEIKYHRSCYKDYVRQRELDKLEENHCREENVSTDVKHLIN